MSSPSTVSGRGVGERGAIGLPPLPLLLWWVYWGRGEVGGGSGAATSRGMLAPAATSRGMLAFGGASSPHPLELGIGTARQPQRE